MNEIAEKLKHEKDQLTDRYSKLFQDGKLVQIHIKKWDMRVSLKKEDLDIAEEKAVSPLFQLGNKLLIDPSVEPTVIAKLGSVAQAARQYLYNHSRPFPIGETHFVPKKRIIPVVTKLNEFRTAYLTLADTFATNYETYKELTLAKHPEDAAALRPYYPEITTIRPRFDFEIQIYEVTFPKKLKRLELEDLELRVEARENLTKLYEKEMEAQYQKAVSRMDEFVSESVRALRSQIIAVFDVITRKIDSGEVVSARNLNSIKNIISNFRSLDFTSDAEIATRLNTVEQLVNSETDFKDNTEAIAQLRTALTSVVEFASNLSDVDTVTGDYFRRMEL